MGHIEQGDPYFRKTLLALFLGSFVTFADLYSTQPVIPLIAEQFGTTPAGASLSLSFSTGTMAIMLVIVSLLTQGINRKKVMGISLTLSALLSVAVLFVHSMPQLLAIRALQGAALAGFPSIAMAYITEEFKPMSLGYVMGIYVSGSSIGGLAGRLIIGTLSDFISWTAAISTLGLLSLLISLLFWKMLPMSTRPKESNLSFKRTMQSLKNNSTKPQLLLLYGMGFLLMGSFVSVYNYIGIPLMKAPYHLSQVVISFIFIVYLVGTFSSTWMGKMADRHQRKLVLLSGVVMMLIGVLLTLTVPLVLKIVGLVIFTFGFFGAHSIASGWVGLLAEQSEKAQASSLYLLFYYAGSSIIGALGGVFLHRNGWSGEVMMVTALLVVGVVFTLFNKAEKKPIRA
ncbi:MFS transporter [Bacillus sp. 1P06AnD]|uniref:MFS transporter n=1 Tax=Bacillus sp. 1P06AnD TaxID=3132208 RepID=UPI0039A197DD